MSPSYVLLPYAMYLIRIIHFADKILVIFSLRKYSAIYKLHTHYILTTFSHNTSFYIAHTPSNSSLFPVDHSLCIQPSIRSVLMDCPYHLTSCRQHSSIILFFTSFSSQSPPPILPLFYVSTRTSYYSSRDATYCT